VLQWRMERVIIHDIGLVQPEPAVWPLGTAPDRGLAEMAVHMALDMGMQILGG
jgi:hypothetical protein